MADGSIKIDTKIDSSSLPKQLRSMETAVKKSTSAMGESFAKMRDVMQGPVAAFQLLKQGFDAVWGSTVGQAAKIEDMTAAFTPLVGGADNARAMIQALNKEAATTPFELEGIGKVAKQLLPVLGNDIEAVTGTFRMLGDTAGGNIEKLDSITRGYVKVMNTGKVSLEALNMISDAGVPIQTQLAESMGMTVQEMYKLITAGEVSSSELTKAFEKMTSEGGLFYKGMDIASQTLSGRLSTMQDNFKQAGAAIGDVFLPMVKAIVSAVSDVVGGFVSWATENNNLATTLKMIAAVGIGIMLSQVVAAMPGVLGSIQALKVAIVSLNTTALFGPTGIIIALGLVVAALIGVGNAVQQSAIKEITEEFKGLMNASKLTAEQIQQVQEVMANASKGEASFEEAQANIKQMSKDLGISEDKVIAIGIASSRVTDEYKKTIKAVQDYNAKLAESNKYIIGTKEWVEEQKKLATAIKDTGKVVETVSKESLELAISWNEKILSSTITRLEKEKKAAIQLAEDKNQSVEEVARIAKYYDDEILSANLKSIEAQRAADLAEAKEKIADAKTVEKTVANINAFYDDQITTFKEGQTNERVQLEKDYTKKFSDESKNRTNAMRDQLNIQDGLAKNVSDSFTIYLAEVTEDIKKDAADWSDVFDTLGKTIKSVVADELKNLGEFLVTGGGFENYGKIALLALSQILNALGAQLAAIAVTKAMAHSYGEAMAAGAASAAAFVASGIAGAMANVASEAQQMAVSTSEVADKLKEILRGGRSSYEDYLGAKQVNDFNAALGDLKNKEAAAYTELSRLGQAYKDVSNNAALAFFTFGTGIAGQQKQIMANEAGVKNYLALTQKQIAAMEEVYDTVYKNNAVTSKSSEILENWAKDLNDAILAYGKTSTEVKAVNEDYQDLLNQALYPMAAALREANGALNENKSLWTDAAKATYAFQTSLSSIREKAASFYESFADIGSDIADTLVSSLTDGLDETSFLDAMKEYITKMVIQAAVYTEALTDKIAKIGKKIASAIAGGLTGNSLSGIKQELADLYAEASGKASAAMDIVNGAFAGNAGVASIASGLGSSLTPSVATTGGSNITVTVNAVNTTVLDGRAIATSVAENIDSVVAAI